MPAEIDQLYWSLGANTAPLIGAVGQAQTRLRKFSAFMTTPIGAVTALGAAAVLAGAKFASMAADLDEALREVGTLLPGTVEDLAGVREQIIALSTRVPLPPVQLTKALYQAVSAGARDTSEALELVEVASRAAVAGMTDAFTAVDAITTVLNAYQLSATQAEHVSDVLFQTVVQGKIRFPELASVIGNVATTAALMGATIEEVSASIAVLTKFGYGAAEATTALNRFLLQGVTATDDMRRAAEEMGFEFTVFSERTRTFTQFLIDMEKATGGNIEKLGKLNPNIRAARAAFIQAAGGLEEYQRILVEANQASGTARDAFEEMAGSAQNLWQLLKNKLNAEMLRLGQPILENVVIPLLEKLNSLFPATGTGAEELTARLAQLNDTWHTTAVNHGIIGSGLERLRDRFADLQQAFAGLELPVPDLAGKTLEEQRTALLQTQTTLQDLIDLYGETSLIGKTKLVPALDAVNAALHHMNQQLAADVDAGKKKEQQDDKTIRTQELVVTVVERVADAYELALERLLAAANDATNLWNQLPTERVERFTEDARQLVPSMKAAAQQARQFVEAGRTFEDVLELLEEMGTSLHMLEKTFPALGAEVRKLSRRSTRELRDTVRELSVAARSVVELGNAFGLLGDDAARAVSQLALVADGVASIDSAIDEAGDAAVGFIDLLPGIGGVLGGVAGIVGSLFGGGGESPEDRQRRELLAANTEAIRRLTESMEGQRRVFATLSGQQLAGLTSILGTIPAGGSFGSVFDRVQFLEDLPAQLAELGLSMTDLEAAASALGIQLPDISEGSLTFVAALRDMQEALQALDLSRALETFTGQMELLRRQFELFDVTDPVAQLEAMRRTFLEFTDLPQNLADALRGFDLTTGEGREAMEEFLRNLFTLIQVPPEPLFVRGADGRWVPVPGQTTLGLGTEALGGLTLDQFLDALGEMESTLDQIAEDQGQATSYQVQRSITEVTGNRLLSALTTDTYWNQQTALNTAGILAILGGEPAALTPPSATELGQFAGSGSVSLTVGSVTIHVDGTADPIETANAVGGTFVDTVDRLLRERQLAKRGYSDVKTVYN